MKRREFVRSVGWASLAVPLGRRRSRPGLQNRFGDSEEPARHFAEADAKK